MSALHRVGVSDGSLLEVLSGVESVARRFDAMLERYVPGAPNASTSDDARTIELLLGLVAVRERLRNVLENASVANVAGAESETAPARVEGSWLR